MLVEHSLDDEAEKVFGKVHVAFKVEVSDLGLDHPKLGEVAPGFRLFGSERRAKAIHLAMGHRRRFHVQLTGLRQVSLPIKVVDGEQVARALHRVGGEHRGVDQSETVAVEIVSDRFDDRVADPKNDVLSGGPKPQVAVIHQKGDAVLLFGDRILLGATDDLETDHRKLEANGDRSSRRTVPVTRSDDSWGSCFALANASASTSFLTITHWSVAVPSRS